MLLKEPTTFTEAMDALASIAELGSIENLSLLDSGDEFSSRAIHWLEEMEPEVAITTIRKLFKLVLEGVRRMDDEAHVRVLMGTVAMAGEKLDRLTTLLYAAREGTVTHLPEYRELQRFYKKEVAPAFDHPHSLRYLDRIKGDHHYELAYLKHEHGQSFLTPEIAGDVHLAADFGEYDKDYVADDPLIRVQSWIEESRHDSAREILRHTRFARQNFVRHSKGADAHLEGALMALRLAANPKIKSKPSSEYFSDFLTYLREALQSDDYQRMLAYGAQRGSQRARLELTQALCVALYTQAPKHQYLLEIVKGYEGTSFAEHIDADYKEAAERLDAHPNGPLFKMLDLLQAEEAQVLDMLTLGNLPESLCDLSVGQHSVSLLRTPSPTHQEYITHADVTPEFRAFLAGSDTPYLLINLQDRMDWQEGARAEAIEHVDGAVVVTLAKDTDFYHQRRDFYFEDDAEDFLATFYDQMSAPHHGYYFPEAIFDELFPEGIEDLLQTTHALFFGGKERLSRKERLDFIELVHFLLVLDLIALVEPGYVSMTCKDAVDKGAAASAALYAGLQILHERPYALEDERVLRAMLLAPAILFRERVPDPARIKRLVQMLDRLEKGVKRLTQEGKRSLFHEQLL